MNVDRKLLAEVVRRVTEVINTERIILFGSAVSGQFGKNSDLDLLLLVRPELNTRANRFRIRNALRGLSMPVDVLMMPTEKFEQTKDVIGGIAYPAHKYGETLYEEKSWMFLSPIP